MSTYLFLSSPIAPFTSRYQSVSVPLFFIAKLLHKIKKENKYIRPITVHTARFILQNITVVDLLPPWLIRIVTCGRAFSRPSNPLCAPSRATIEPAMPWAAVWAWEENYYGWRWAVSEGGKGGVVCVVVRVVAVWGVVSKVVI